MAFILDYFGTPAGGTESQLLALLRNLDRHRFDPRVYLLREPDNLTALMPELAVAALGIGPLARPRSVLRLCGLACRLKSEGVRLAHLYFNDASIALPILLRAAGVSVIVSRRDLGYWHTPAVLAALHAQRWAVSAVVANSQAVRDRVARAEGYQSNRVHVIPNGKDPERLPWTRAEARRQLGLDAHDPILVILANLRPLKRVDDVIAALPAILQRFPAAQLILVGADHEGTQGGSHGAELGALASRLGVGPAVRMVGEVRDPRPYIVAADVCLLCSETEGFSNSILEYMLAERPCVATRVGGNGELIRDGDTGALVDVGRPAEIAAAVVAFLQDPQRARAVAARARDWVAGRYSVAAMVNAHMALYESIAGSGPGAR